MIFLKTPFRVIYRHSAIARNLYFLTRFLQCNRYWPNFKNPRTYNEKINNRKRDPKNPLFVTCSDKVLAKEYVAEKLAPEIIIPNYYVGTTISFQQLKAILQKEGDCFLKANHNSGPVQLLTSHSSDEEIHAAIASVNQQLKMDYGKQKLEPWYSEIKRLVLVEKRLEPEHGDIDIRDYKFHVFNQPDGTTKIIVSVDFDRSGNHTRSFYDENLNWLPFSIKYPTVVTDLERPENYDQMLEIARFLAKPFTYLRVDLYNVKGQIYFGELTFAHGGGGEEFTARAYDLWMGLLWHGDPRY